ncbi:MAG: sortase, partial [Firmicutes bacterium]|nr:sortase [Bacillota bacterium]
MKNKNGSFLLSLGLLLIVAALFLSGYNLWEERQAAASAAVVLEQMELPQPPASEEAEDADEGLLPDYLLNPNMEMPVQSIDGADYIGVLEIPSLGLALPIRSEWSYPALKTAPCRYKGSAYLDDLILAGHNYESHFAKLKQLSPGEELFFRDMDGNLFSYQVLGLEILQPEDVEAMESGDWDLSLFTCTIGGSSR